VLSFLDPEANPLGSGYHINQALIAIGAGGLAGVGFGESTTKIQYLPEPIGDSIFAVLAEELGFVGSVSLIAIFAILVLKILLLARKTKDKFGKLLLVGFGSLISLQVFINIAAISGLIPLTGVPLPFISYGGTALAAFMTMGGIIANISKYS
jgi:cell division protein FtsW